MQTENRHIKHPMGKEPIEPANSRFCYLPGPPAGEAYARTVG